ncbi:MAG: hypothetical protein AB4352_07965 [Hormoscilla sp.]
MGRPEQQVPDRGDCAEGRNVFAIETCWWGVTSSIIVRLMGSNFTIRTENQSVTQ